jgi:hypothetical protein
MSKSSIDTEYRYLVIKAVQLKPLGLVPIFPKIGAPPDAQKKKKKKHGELKEEEEDTELGEEKKEETIEPYNPLHELLNVKPLLLAYASMNLLLHLLTHKRMLHPDSIP